MADMASSSIPPHNYAFLNHSSATLPHNLPPNVDDKPLARQRRRRTSPEDQSILEAAYNRDPKPDKAARLELVKQVALGEKEVQIWFQNRRQSSRRKSRPLLPHEIEQYHLSQSQSSTGPPASSSGFLSSSSFDDDSNVPADLTRRSSDSEQSVRAGREVTAELSGSMALPSTAIESSQSSTDKSATDKPTSTTGPSQMLETRVLPQPRASVSSNSDLPSIGYRPSDPNLYNQSTEKAASERLGHAEPSTGLKKRSSFIRLSMNNEGNATIETKNTFSPSPQKPSEAAKEADDTAQGISSLPHSLSQSSCLPAKRPLQRSASGRSRDSRAWEFWCDRDTRGELEDKAEKDSSGSAADAIGLLRSSSGRSILGTIPSKRNSTLSRHSSSFKRSRLDSSTPPTFTKSSTSQGRLQNKPSANTLAKPAQKLKQSISATSIHIPGNESDKENWSPEAEEGDISSKSISRAEEDPEADPELSAFMRGGARKATREDDMDCVQGLLSLSQGNWR